MIAREEIVKYLLDTKLIETCVKYRMNKCTNRDLKEEMIQDCWVWVLDYDLEKLSDAYENKHLNALITRYICNQWFSKTSEFYRKYRRPLAMADGLEKIKNDEDNDGLRNTGYVGRHRPDLED